VSGAAPSLAAALGPGAATALLAALRLAPLVLTSPLLGGPLVPGPARAALALGLGAAVAAALPAQPPFADGLALAAAGLREGALGLVLALVVGAPIEAARAGGRLADTFRGATLAELHVAPLRQRESASGDLLAHGVLVLAAWAGADRLVVSSLLRTFEAVPPGAAALLGAPGLEVALHAGAGLLAAAAAIAAPAAAGVLAADLALALVARVAPQLGAVNAAQPARAAFGLLALAAAFSACAGRLVALVVESAALVTRAAGGAP